MSYNKWHYTPNITVYADVDDILDQISFSKIEKTYNKRKEEKESNQDTFEKYEKANRDDSQVEIEVNPDEHDLMSIDDEDLDNFDFDEIINYIENHSHYCVLKNGDFSAGMNAVSSYIGDLTSWKLKDVLCDICGISHLSTKEDIINALKEKI